MPDTYSDLETQLRSRLDEIGLARQWSSTELIRWLYDGAKDIAKKTECLRATKNITAVNGTQTYTMPTDAVRVHRVEHVNTGDTTRRTLEYRDFDSADSVWWTQQTVTRDTPYMFTMWGYPPNLSLVAYPTPAAAGTFKVYYYKLPANPFDEAVPADEDCDIVEGWSNLALDYASYMALLKDADDRWQIYKALYEENRAELNELALRYSDQAGMFTDDMGMMVPRFIWDEGYVG